MPEETAQAQPQAAPATAAAPAKKQPSQVELVAAEIRKTFGWGQAKAAKVASQLSDARRNEILKACAGKQAHLVWGIVDQALKEAKEKKAPEPGNL